MVNAHPMTQRLTEFAAAAILALPAALASPQARADKIVHPTAVFSGLDKITGRIISFDVASDETVQFGSLQITPRACYTRPATEAPQTDGFVEVDEVQTDNKFKRIFSGWMYAASPGLHGVEHPVYDVWLTDCKGDGPVVADAPPAQPATADLAPTLDPSNNPSSKVAARPRRGAPNLLPPPGAALPPAVDPMQSAGPLDPQRPAAPPPARRPPPSPAQAAASGQRRSPIQSFFPTASEPGESARERDMR